MSFKRQISILVAFLILVSNSGLAFNLHYCEGKIAAVTSVFSKDEICEEPVKVDDACCAKPQTSHKKCCSDKEVNLKNKAEKIIIKTISLDFPAAFFTECKDVAVLAGSCQNVVLQRVAFYCETHAPPLYQLYCQYTLYA